MSCQLDAGALRQAWRRLSVARVYETDPLIITVDGSWAFLSTPGAVASLRCTSLPSGRPLTGRVPARRFGRLIERLPSGPVSLADDQGDLVVQAGGSTARFYGPAHKGAEAAKAWRAARGLPQRA